MPGMEGQVREQGIRKELPTFRWLEKPELHRNRIAMGRPWEIESGLTIEACGGTQRNPYGEIDTAATRAFFFVVVNLLFNG